MNQDEIKKEIATKSAFYGAALLGFAKDYNAEITELESHLAEAEKPKLKHGDYGHDEDGGDRFVVIEQSTLFGSPKAFYANQNGQVDVNESTVSRIRLGNIFDDLKALAEPLKEFEYGDITGRISVDETRPSSVCIGGFWHTIKTPKILSGSVSVSYEIFL